jgi:ketosteroid isomerase-like protein
MGESPLRARTGMSALLWAAAGRWLDTSLPVSEENVAVVRRAFDAYSEGDIDAVLGLCAEDIVITQAAEVPGVSPQQRGHEGVLEAFGTWPEQWDAFQIEIQRIVADPGDHLVVATRQSGRGKQSGVEVEGEFTFVFTVRDGKVTEWRIFLDESQALAETGLRA